MKQRGAVTILLLLQGTWCDGQEAWGGRLQEATTRAEGCTACVRTG